MYLCSLHMLQECNVGLSVSPVTPKLSKTLVTLRQREREREMRSRLTKKSKIAYLYKKRGSNVLVFFAHMLQECTWELLSPSVSPEKRYDDFDIALIDFRGHGDSPKYVSFSFIAHSSCSAHLRKTTG